MGNAIEVRKAGFSLTSTEFETMQRMAKAMASSNYFSDVKDVAQAIVKIQAGSELGIPPFAALTGVHIIKNKPVLGSNLIATLVKNSGRYNYRVKVCDDKECVIEWYEDGEPVGQAGFTMDEAQSAGLTGKDNWRKYPSDMLFARAISRGARRFAPGIFGGAPVYTPDEMGADEDEEGFVVSKVEGQDDGNQQTKGQKEVMESVEQVGLKHHPDLYEAEFEEINDTRAETSPQAQAERKRPEPEPTKASSNGNGIDWKAKAMGQKFPTFASCLENAAVGYTSVKHVENALEKLGENFSEDDTERLWDVLVSRKEQDAA